MYLRHSTVKKNGKTHTYWRLVRSVRVGNKVRQQTVAQLGELDAKGRAKASALEKHIKDRLGNLFDLDADEFYTHLYWSGDAAQGGSIEMNVLSGSEERGANGAYANWG